MIRQRQSAPSPRRSSPPREAGSTLILVAIVVLIISLIAASLLFVTQIEREIGVASRQLTQSDHLAESGEHAAIGALIVSQDWGGERFAVVERQVAGVTLGQRVETTRVQAMGPPQPPPLSIANEGEDRYHTFSVILQASAERVAWPSTVPTPFYSDPVTERRRVETMARSVQDLSLFLSPIPRPVSPSEPYSDEQSVEIQ